MSVLVLAENSFWLYILLCTVLGVQYKCGVVLVFLVLAGNSCAVVSVFGSGGKLAVFCCGGKVLLRPEKKVQVVCLAGCAVVSIFGSGGK